MFTKFLFFFFFYTVNSQDEGCGWSLNAAFGDRVGDHAGVVPYIRGFHFRDEEVARLLGHESPRVLDDKRRVLIEDPCEGKLCERKKTKNKTKTVNVGNT